MNTSIKEFLLIALLILFATFIQQLTKGYFISFVSAIILISITISWGAIKPWPYLIAFALLMETLSFQPPGMFVLLIFLPILVRRLAKRISVDLSFSFLFILSLTVSMQMIVFVLTLGLNNITKIPWHIVLLSIAVTGVVSLATTLFFQYFLPETQQGIISLDSKRL